MSGADDHARSRHSTDPLRDRTPGFTTECARSFQAPGAEVEQVREVFADLPGLAAGVVEQVGSDGRPSVEQRRTS